MANTATVLIDSMSISIMKFNSGPMRYALQPVGWPLCKSIANTHMHRHVNLVWFITFLLITITNSVWCRDYVPTEYKRRETKYWTWHINSNQRSYVFRPKRFAAIIIGGYMPLDVALAPSTLRTSDCLKRIPSIDCSVGFVQFSFFIIKFKHSLVFFCFVLLVEINYKIHITYYIISSFFFFIVFYLYQYSLIVD